MYVFDTNVLSEITKAEPAAAVAAWLSQCPLDATLTTAISRVEILYGIRRLPEGARRTRLATAAYALFTQTFAGRILPFDDRAADAYADIRLTRQRIGRPVTTEDAMIAAIARPHAASLVTRDEGGFFACGIATVNPWHYGG